MHSGILCGKISLRAWCTHMIRLIFHLIRVNPAFRLIFCYKFWGYLAFLYIKAQTIPQCNVRHEIFIFVIDFHMHIYILKSLPLDPDILLAEFLCCFVSIDIIVVFCIWVPCNPLENNQCKLSVYRRGLLVIFHKFINDIYMRIIRVL